MGVKSLINGALRLTGYQFCRTPSVKRYLREGRFRWLQERGIATVLDVGGNEGQFASLIREILPDAVIHSFEPLASCYEVLTHRATRLQPMICHNVALGSREATAEIFHNEFSASSSLLPMKDRHREAYPQARQTKREQIVVKTLDGMGADLVLRSPALLKIDVQGYELEVLSGAERALRMVDVIIVEMSFEPLYEGQPLFDDIYAFLRQRDFAFAGNLEQSADPGNGQFLQADAIFVRVAR